MLLPIYNSRQMVTLLPARQLAIVLAATFFFASFARADSASNDLANAEKDLAHKIAALTGPGAVNLSVDNRSSLTVKQADAVRAGLQMQLEALGVHMVGAEQAAATVSVTLSESPQFYVWSAAIQAGNQSSSALTSLPRPEQSMLKADAFLVTLRKQPLWEQAEPILDVAVLQEKATPTEIAVLDPEAVTFYAQRNGQWAMEQRLPVSHDRPWPRDVRGRLLVDRDRALQVYMPGVRCATRKQGGLALDCGASDDPWPIGMSGVTQSAFYTVKRNLFTGDLTPPIGKLATVPKFYSAAAFPRAGYVFWLFTGADGTLHRVDGMTDQPMKLNWGSDLAVVRSACGTGLALLATSDAAAGADAVRAYDVPDRDPVPVSAPLEFDGPVVAMWAAGNADSAVAVTTNRETGKYEAYRLQVACSQ